MNLNLGPSIAKTPRQHFQPNEAEKVAAELNSADDWDYVVRHAPSGKGFSFIEIYDEDGEFIAYF